MGLLTNGPLTLLIFNALQIVLILSSHGHKYLSLQIFVINMNLFHHNHKKNVIKVEILSLDKSNRKWGVSCVL